jgi:hypothetical protein
VKVRLREVNYEEGNTAIVELGNVQVGLQVDPGIAL